MKKKKKEMINEKESCDKELPQNLSQDLLFEEIKEASEGLYYISETDAGILPFVGRKADEVSKEEILNQTDSSASANVEERDFEEFFERMTKIQNWFSEEETANARKFAELKYLLKRNLRNLKVFKVGEIEIDIYFVGLDEKNILKGIKTKAVET